MPPRARKRRTIHRARRDARAEPGWRARRCLPTWAKTPCVKNIEMNHCVIISWRSSKLRRSASSRVGMSFIAVAQRRARRVNRARAEQLAAPPAVDLRQSAWGTMNEAQVHIEWAVDAAALA